MDENAEKELGRSCKFVGISLINFAAIVPRSENFLVELVLWLFSVEFSPIDFPF